MKRRSRDGQSPPDEKALSESDWHRRAQQFLTSTQTIPQVFGKHPGVAIAPRYKGTLVPVTGPRIVYLGPRGGLFEWRKVSFDPNRRQRVSLLARDQQRVVDGTLPNGQGVCGYVEPMPNKPGKYRLRENAPVEIQQFVVRSQREREKEVLEKRLEKLKQT